MPDLLITDLPKATNTMYLKNAGIVKFAVADVLKTTERSER